MKIKAILILSIIMLTALINVKAAKLKKNYENFVTYLVDGFDKENSWQVKFSRFRVHNWDTNKREFQPSHAFMRWKKIKKDRYARFLLPPYPREQLRRMSNPNEQLKNTVAAYGESAVYSILGIRAKFVINGYNWVVVEPRRKLEIKGIAKAISFWLWGGNYRYNTSIFVKDFKGLIHEIPGEKLNFIGWKLVRFKIPNYIPQRDVHLPANKYLEFLRIKFISEFDETPDKFYVWLASMFAEVDLYKDRFYGEGLVNEPNW